jgi:hypothetical protein
MAARLIGKHPGADVINELLREHGRYIKLAVDVVQRRIAGGGEWHADAEAVLLETGSEQDNIWGGDWVPATKTVEFESMINISSHRGNYGNVIARPDVREMFEEIVREQFDN